MVAALLFLSSTTTEAADHNDPNGVNSIFSDISTSPGDLYDIFGFPSDDTSGGEKVVVALTFASVPRTGVFDSDFLYRIKFAPSARVTSGLKDDETLTGMLKYFESLKDKYVGLKPAELRVNVDPSGNAKLQFSKFPDGDFTRTVETNKVVTIDTPGGHQLKIFVGGRDDAFFNDLPGFFRSINYAPQFYKVPVTEQSTLREIHIPKTLLELEGNALFNFDPASPKHGQGLKLDLPPGPYEWKGNKYHKDEKGNYRFVYSGRDAQAGMNVNAIIIEAPLAFVTTEPATQRIVNTWGESWVLKASNKVETIADERARVKEPFLLAHPFAVPALVVLLGLGLLALGVRKAIARRAAGGLATQEVWRWAAPTAQIGGGVALLFIGIGGGAVASMIADQLPDLAKGPSELDQELRQYKLVDTDGQAFADAALNQRENDRQLGAFNFSLGPSFVPRLAHLGWGFGPSIAALGLKSSFDHSGVDMPTYKEVTSVVEAFPRARKVILQRLNMPDDKWNKKGLDIPLKRPIEIFVPNVCPIDMDTTGTWPYGRRPEDQVATRFLALFLDMSAERKGKKYNLETLADQSLWDAAPIEPKTPPNPLKNDKPFLAAFPYLAEPW